MLLLAQDYLNIINKLLQQHQQHAAQPHQQQQQQQVTMHDKDPADSNHAMSAAEAASMASTLQLFRDHVVPACHDASIPRATLLQLLSPIKPPGAAGALGSSLNRTQQANYGRDKPSGRGSSGSGSGSTGPVSAAARERHLLSLDLVTRDSRCSSSYLLTVPGAAPFVKSVLAGRQEMLQLLSRKK